MPESDQTNLRKDEILFAAESHTTKVLLCVMIVGWFPLLMAFGGAYFAFVREDYFGGALLWFFGFIMLYVPLDAIFFKELLFYQDRVVKVWHLLGQKSIPYSRASVKGPDWYMRWLSSAHHIFESKDDGKPIPMRLPLLYHSFFFTPKTRKRIEMIMDYMTEDKENNPRKFRKSVLPKEVMLREP
jgi:hypothetical protein